MANLIIDTNNQLFQLASDLVNQSSRNIFLTGKAGTGKTTFLKYIRENCSKQIAVVAPTGVAAINAGGVTMHSFFQLPMNPFIPKEESFGKNEDSVTNRNSLLSRLIMTNEKKKILQELELLIIDEISMVRCDMLDAVDTVLRHIRHKHNEKFGGVQVLFIGDMFQLPPVTKEQDWSLLKPFYSSPYFFDSFVIKEDPPLYIEFNKIYRQSEEKFITLLNRVRNNELDEDGSQLLESRFQPNFRRKKNDGFIVLTTHNEKARIINSNELNDLGSQPFVYTAEIVDDFPENAYPAEELLQLKIGAQVMFIKNDSDKSKRYFNGKIGMVTELEKEKIIVQCDGESAIEVKKENWQNIRYSVDAKSRQMKEEELGSFVQYPLRLAWAITIHKSQGLTFEKAIIDAGNAFAPGQVYVALSRCTTLSGIILQSMIRSNGLHSDDRIVQFSQRNSSARSLEHELKQSRKNYQLSILCSLFDYSWALAEAKSLMKYLSEHKSSFNSESINWMNELLKLLSGLQTTAEKFQSQLKKLFQQENDSETNSILQERLKAGSMYFLKEQNSLVQLLIKSPAITDSRIHAKEFNESAKEIFAQLAIKKHLLESIEEEFEIETYQSRKKSFVLPSININAYAGTAKQRVESPHPILHQQLRKLRDTICSKKDLPIYIVAGSTTLDEMSRYLPQTLKELRKISGFGDVKIEQYGQQFLDIILDYCKEKNLPSLIHEKTTKRERKEKSGEKKVKIDTKAESFRLYKEGKMFEEIANERKLTIQTIEGHLAHYVQLGEIKINELVNKEKIGLIESTIKNNSGKSITAIKENLGNSISFGEIKLVLAGLEFRKNSSSHEHH